MIFFFAVAIC